MPFAVMICCGSIGLQKEIDMTNSTVRARIDDKVKAEASAVLDSIGLTVSDAFRMLMVRIAREKALPFDFLMPNQTTIESMKAADRGDTVKVGSVSNLIASLNGGN